MENGIESEGKIQMGVISEDFWFLLPSFTKWSPFFYLLQSFSALVAEVNVYYLLDQDTLWLSMSLKTEMCGFYLTVIGCEQLQGQCLFTFVIRKN